METILKLFRKDDSYEYAEEQDMFKSCFKRYCVRTIKGRIELWARDTRKPESYFIGKLVGDNIEFSKQFYTYPYDLLKGGRKLVRVYLHNDWRDL